MKINLKKLGEHEIILPKSVAVSLDFVSIWGSDLNRAQLGRLCAGAIAVGVDHAKCLPAYPIHTGDPIKFGFKVMERLLEAGCTPADIYDIGTQILLEMVKIIPSEEQVENQTNWFYTLDEQTKINVLAEYRLFHEDSDKIKKRQDRNKSDMMKREIERRTE